VDLDGGSAAMDEQGVEVHALSLFAADGVTGPDGELVGASARPYKKTMRSRGAHARIREAGRPRDAAEDARARASRAGG